MYDRNQVGKNEPVRLECSVEGVEESIQSKVADILNMARHSRGSSESIKSSLFGATPQADEKEPHICCLEDALNIIRNTLRETIDTLESINRKL